MADREKVICGWERCRKHTCPSIDSKEYADCEYTVGLYCRQDLLIDDTIALLKEQQEQIYALQVELASAEENAEGCAELLKEQEAVVKQWIKEIADNQLAHAPKDSYEFMSLDEHLENEYKRGIWDGLQIAWNIISEGR